MKQQIPVWVALTFLMIFLVVVAAMIFLFQGRYLLQDQVATLEAQGTRTVLQSDSLALTATAQAIALADTQATRSALEAQVNNLETNLDELAGDSVNALATIAAQEEAAAAEAERAPEIVIDPADGATLPPGEPVALVVSVADPQGIMTVTVSANGELLRTFNAQGEVLFFNSDLVWQPADATSVTISVTATNSLGEAATHEVTAELVDREAVLTALVARVLSEVETLRELEARTPVTPTLYTAEQLRANLETLFLDDIEPQEAREDVIELYAFDFVALDYDLYEALLDLYSDSVLGYYDPDLAQLVVISDDAQVDPLEQLTLAHELTHALQDQVYGLDFDAQALDSEALIARRALAEGDATLLQTLYLASPYLTEAELELLFDQMASNSTTTTPLPDLPPILAIQQEFPYSAGYAFVQALYREGGYAAVNEAWENPPQNTEHILHPERYLAGETPVSVSLPPLTSTLGSGWALISEDVLGEFYMQAYLDQQLPASQATTAATGWNGDRYAVYWQEEREQVVLVLRTRWDSDIDQREFEQAMRNYLNAGYGSQGSESTQVGALCWDEQAGNITCVRTEGEETIVLRAPTFTLAAAILADVLAAP